MAPLNVLQFYAEAHWGSRYGVIDSAHPTPHKGLDCGLFRGAVEVPALHSGTVVAVAPSSSVGHYVTVKRPDQMFDTYCHIVPGVAVGQAVAQGAGLGRQAETSAEGGTAWLGQHTHLCLSNTIAGWASWDDGKHNLDPTPGVIAALTVTTSAGSTPLDQIGTSIMSLLPVALKIVNKDAAGNVTAAGLSGVYLTLGLDGGYVYPASEVGAITNVAGPYFNKTDATPNGQVLEISQENLHILLRDLCYQSPGSIVEQVAVAGGGIFLRDVKAAPVTLTDAQITALAAAVKPVDLAPLLASIAALDTQADNYQANLTDLLKKGLSGSVNVTLTPAK